MKIAIAFGRIGLLQSALLCGWFPAHAQAPGTPATPGGPPAAPAAAAPQRPRMPEVGVPTLGMPFVHDPSTVVRFHGRYYVYSTGRGIPFYSSADGETWTREGSVFTSIPDAVHAAVPKNNGTDVWAPDLLRAGNQFLLYYAVSSWGSFQSVVALATNSTLDPKDPDYKWVDRGVVVSSDGKEDLNAIDPGVILTPEGKLWICYGSYHGSIRITQLDPHTGLALAAKKKLGEPIASARESEASEIIFHGGFYYLLVNHGSCCKGKDSQYNIRVGRARKITGPYLDKHGDPLTTGGGSLFLAAHDHRIGPGHFALLADYDAPSDGPERFSVHYEADLARGGRSTLEIRPLLWSLDGWPVAGDNLPDGSYQLVSRQSENSLGIYAAGVSQPSTSAGRPGAPVEPLRLNRYLARENEQWKIAPAGGGFYRIVNRATGEALERNPRATGSVTTAASFAAFTGSDDQLWALDQFPDGSYRIRNKRNGMCLSAAPQSTAVFTAPFAADDLHLWNIATP